MSPQPLAPRGIPISELGLPPTLYSKVTVDDTICDTFDLRVLHPDALRQFWNLSAANFERINKALEEKGLTPLDLPDGVTRQAKPKPTCDQPGLTEESLCQFGRMKGKRKCAWHWLMTLPIEKQIEIADQRAAGNRRKPEHVERMRVPEAEWPAGGRWCSECQGFIPWLYVTGSKCKAHASRAAHGTRLKAVYDITREQYEQLLEFQGGRCYICRQYPQSKRLAVDHDHRTDAVRGLLCANDEWGCNVTLRRLLNSVEMAQRALEYVTLPPFDRMRLEMSGPAESEPVITPAEAWNPFA